MEYFPALALKVLALLDPSKRLSDIYLKFFSLINYMLICSIGVVINMYVLHYLVNMMPLYLADACAIFMAFIWNFAFTVGPLGYIMGLSPKKKVIKGGT